MDSSSEYAVIGSGEVAIMHEIRKRLELGKAQYGAFKLSEDRRDFLREALEEALDLAIYLAARLIQINGLRREISELVEVWDEWQGSGYPVKVDGHVPERFVELMWRIRSRP